MVKKGSKKDDGYHSTGKWNHYDIYECHYCKEHFIGKEAIERHVAKHAAITPTKKKKPVRVDKYGKVVKE